MKEHGTCEQQLQPDVGCVATHDNLGGILQCVNHMSADKATSSPPRDDREGVTALGGIVTDGDSSPPVGTNCHDSPAKTEYRLHEFGVMYRSHAFSYWPGFSLNPALWDLRRLEHSYRRKYNRPFRFNEGNIRQVRHVMTQAYVFVRSSSKHLVRGQLISLSNSP